MRYYRIKNVKTGKFVRDVACYFSTKEFTSYIDYYDTPTTDPIWDIYDINVFIRKIVERKLSAQLDDLEIVTYEQIYPEIKSSIKMKNVRNRIEQKLIIEKLKG